MPSLDMILARGGLFTYVPDPGMVALTLLDSVRPVGACRLVLDWASLLPQLGALARSVPMASTQVLERDALLELGTAIAPVGTAEEGQNAVRVMVEYEDGSSVSVVVPFGAIHRIPLGAGKRAVLTLRPSRHLDIGMGHKGTSGKISVSGGAVGVIIDARGRPLRLPTDRRRRLAKVQEWYRCLQA